jgi:hypothetical protein
MWLLSLYIATYGLFAIETKQLKKIQIANKILTLPKLHKTIIQFETIFFEIDGNAATQ